MKLYALGLCDFGFAARQRRPFVAGINADNLRLRAASDRQVNRITAGSAPGVQKLPSFGSSTSSSTN